MNKKNCYNCEYLEWGYGDINDPEGWVCNKRSYDSDKQESAHLRQLESEAYRLMGKRCFVEVHSWHTKVFLKGFKGSFNSVCFKEG